MAPSISAPAIRSAPVDWVDVPPARTMFKSGPRAIASDQLPSWRRQRSCRSPLAGEMPAGRGGCCSSDLSIDRSHALKLIRAGKAEVEVAILPPSVLPDISPARGEIGCRFGFRQSPAPIQPLCFAALFSSVMRPA
ncbi:hypothetical protein MES4922_360158 [Mesorhizobium ventifaucium]|uniref:LysR substrate-binding domain-containing protein n=1 Tax=Mesorhizobium ventifaucium TaxID=666020 RepID=A0ABM9E5Y5_9HYPH|nr:hypothetical protein MES4922_360158 [Mesorhizobium ventifaucium]